jgi:hypothetical protein
MTPAEQTAFIDAYTMFVGDADRDTVTEFVRQYNAGDIIYKGRGYTSIMDAMVMWHGAIKWQTKQTQEALELSKAELYRHATDTESGERAITAVELALEKTA